MGLAVSAEDATARRPHTPKLAFVAPARDYRASDSAPVAAADIDLVARILSMGALHHAFTGTGAVALAVAAVLPGTLVHELFDGRLASGAEVRIGHAAGVMAVGAAVIEEGDRWRVEKVVLRRSARRLMEGWVLVPEPAFGPSDNRFILAQ